MSNLTPTGKCPHCQAQIAWVKTAKGTRIPVLPEPTLKGNIWLDSLAHAVLIGGRRKERLKKGGELLYHTHWHGSCMAGVYKEA